MKSFLGLVLAGLGVVLPCVVGCASEPRSEATAEPTGVVSSALARCADDHKLERGMHDGDRCSFDITAATFPSATNYVVSAWNDNNGGYSIGATWRPSCIFQNLCTISSKELAPACPQGQLAPGGVASDCAGYAGKDRTEATVIRTNAEGSFSREAAIKFGKEVCEAEYQRMLKDAGGSRDALALKHCEAYRDRLREFASSVVPLCCNPTELRSEPGKDEPGTGAPDEFGHAEITPVTDPQ